MFERAAQVNARFAEGAGPQAAIVAALRALGLGEEQINVIERADPGEWQERVARGRFARLRGLLGGAPHLVAAPPPPAMYILVHLGRDDALAGEVQAVFRRFGATQVEHYTPGPIATRAFGGRGASSAEDAAQFRAAFPAAEQRPRAGDAAPARHVGGAR